VFDKVPHAIEMIRSIDLRIRKLKPNDFNWFNTNYVLFQVLNFEFDLVQLSIVLQVNKLNYSKVIVEENEVTFHVNHAIERIWFDRDRNDHRWKDLGQTNEYTHKTKTRKVNYCRFSLELNLVVDDNEYEICRDHVNVNDENIRLRFE